MRTDPNHAKKVQELRESPLVNGGLLKSRRVPEVRPEVLQTEPTDDRHGGLSDAAVRGLMDLEARIPPPEAYTSPAHTSGYLDRSKLHGDHAAGGGLVTGDDGSKRPRYWGHRERLRTRFLSGGHAPMPEYELLELMLFNAIGRIDVKPLAKRLLAAFGDLNGVIAASEHRLLQIEGATPRVYYHLRLMEAFAHRMGQAKILQRDVVSSWDDLVAYCRTVMAHRETEQFRILYLNRRNVLIADEAAGAGTVDHVPVYPREVAKRSLELNATAIILVHNHPSGDPTPSEADIEVTAQVQPACDAIGVVIHDHVIIGKERETSFKADHLM